MMIYGSRTEIVNFFLFLSLAVNPGVQEKLYHEVKSVIGTTGSIDPHDIAKLQYLKAFLKEVFRYILN